MALGLAWLPMSTFAQMCATHSMAMKTGGATHPALPQTDAEIAAFGGGSAFSDVVVVDAETFWHSVDSYDEPCQAKAMCTFANAALLSEINVSFALDSTLTIFSGQSVFPRSHERAPATPPPRNLL